MGLRWLDAGLRRLPSLTAAEHWEIYETVTPSTYMTVLQFRAHLHAEPFMWAELVMTYMKSCRNRTYIYYILCNASESESSMRCVIAV